jgi:hypothetical protein
MVNYVGPGNLCSMLHTTFQDHCKQCLLNCQTMDMNIFIAIMSSAMVIQEFRLKNTDDNMWPRVFQIKKLLVLLVEFTVHYLQSNKLLVSKCIINVTTAVQ